MDYPSKFQCPECAAILRELRDAPRSDTEKLRDEWLSTGRDLEELRDAMLASIAHDDSVDVTATYYPRTAEARRRKMEHEALTGHYVLIHGLRGLFRQNL
jgi:hypothetical protein